MTPFPIATLFLGLLAFSCSGPSITSDLETQVFKDVNLVSLEEGRVIPGQLVVVRAGKIVQVGTPGELVLPEGARVIPSAGKYLMPGLTEMHAHIPQPRLGPDILEEVLFLYLSNGITTIRGMLGHPTHLDLRLKADSGVILSPRIFTSGPSLNGNTVRSLEEAREKVKDQQRAGYDFLKLHPGLRREVFDEIVRTAREVDIPFAGHVSVDVGIEHALRSGYATVDHVDGFLEGLVPLDSLGLSPDQNGFFGFNFTPHADKDRIPELVALSLENGVWVVPTQSLFDRWASPADPDSLAAQAEMRFMPASTVDNWVRTKRQFLESPDFDPATWERFIDIRRQLILALYERGQGLLLGSDAPQVFNVPGFSIHREMASLAKAGLAPLDILRTGTIHPARFFGEEGGSGVIRAGARADLILLEENPLDDLEHLRNPVGVMAAGRWLDRPFIEQELERIAVAFSKL